VKQVLSLSPSLSISRRWIPVIQLTWQFIFMFTVDSRRFCNTNFPCNILMRWPDGVCQLSGWTCLYIWCLRFSVILSD
jgi:hypothetical protein